jgi:hypothetical protein
MPVPPETPASSEKTGCYVYGIVPVDVRVNWGVYGVENREIRLVRCGAVAAQVSNSIGAKREEDTRLLLSAMEDYSEASFVREPTQELDAVHVAFLLDVSKADELERVTGDLVSRWEGRVE